MATLGFNFDANTVQPQESFSCLPAGFYQAMITESEMKDTSTGGQMLVLTVEIIDGKYKGRRIWERLNLVNQNTTAVEIAQRSLSAICYATKQMQVTDSAQLHHKPMVIKLKVNPAKNGYEESNGVAGWEEYTQENSVKCAANPAPVATDSPTQAPATDKPAWAS